MAINIIQQPAADTLQAAYRPIRFLLDANQLPTNSNPCPIVMADVYIDGLYYSSISVTDYDLVVVWIFSFNFYTFDIQDKVQEYLNSKFARMYENTTGDMEDIAKENFSCRVQVKFREGYIDADGFTRFYGTAPVAGTKFTAPVAGTGTATSNTFYVLNATLTHEDNPSLGLHLESIKDPFQPAYTLSHRPNRMPSINKTVAGGKYFITKDDHDYIFFFSNNYNPPTWNVFVAGKYRSGASFNTSSIIGNYPKTSTTATPYRVYSFNAGIPKLRAMFANVQWDNVAEYEVFIVSFMFQAIRQYYYVDRPCDEHVRIFFLNNLGTYDGINFSHKQELNKSSSDSWQSSPPNIFSQVSKAYHAQQRKQPKQNDFYEAQCVCYYEQDMNWIKELLGSPRAYIHWDGTQGQRFGLLPVIIEDQEVVTLKNNGRHEYLIIIKFKLSNERINLRG